MSLYGYVGSDPVNFIDPSGFAWYDNWHFEGRDELNSNLPSYEEANSQNSNWILLPEAQAIYHNNGVGKPELKFINPDGREAVYDGDTLCLVTDPEYKGTYNYVNPAPFPTSKYDVVGWGRFAAKGAGHFFTDMLPYYVFDGNTRN